MTKCCHAQPWIASLLACLFALSAGASDWTPVALRGDPVPDLGSTFNFVSYSRVTADGELAFWAYANDNDKGIFRWSRAEGLSLWVSEEDLRAQFSTGWPIFTLDGVLWNGAGEGMLRTSWTTGGPGCVDLPLVIRLPRDGDPQRVASIGQAVGEGAYLLSSDMLVYSDAGEIAGTFWVVDAACVTEFVSGAKYGIVAPDGAGGVELVAVEDSPVEPDEDDGRVLFYAGNVLLDDAGAVVFEASLGPPEGEPDRFVLYRRAPGEAPVPLAEIGEPVPGLDSTAVLEGFGLPVGNGAGTIVVPATIARSTPGEDPARTDLLISSAAGGAFEPWVRTGDPAPIGVSEATIDALYGPRLSDGGVLAFVAQTNAAAGSRDALFVRGTDGTLTARAVEGAAPEGLGLDDWLEFSVEHVDDDGSLLFQARLLPDGSGVNARRGLFLARPDASPQLLAETEDWFELVSGEPEALDLIVPARHEALDTVAAHFFGRVSSRSALYALQAPEPSGAPTAAAAALALLAVLARRRRSGDDRSAVRRAHG